MAVFCFVGQIRAISAKAETTERMVQDICKGIRELDWAKKHLTTTITSLKRLHMLVRFQRAALCSRNTHSRVLVQVSAVEKLDALSSQKQYAEIQKLLSAIHMFLGRISRVRHFASRRAHTHTACRGLCKLQGHSAYSAADEESRFDKGAAENNDFPVLQRP